MSRRDLVMQRWYLGALAIVATAREEGHASAPFVSVAGYWVASDQRTQPQRLPPLPVAGVALGCAPVETELPWTALDALDGANAPAILLTSHTQEHSALEVTLVPPAASNPLPIGFPLSLRVSEAEDPPGAASPRHGRQQWSMAAEVVAGEVVCAKRKLPQGEYIVWLLQSGAVRVGVGPYGVSGVVQTPEWVAVQFKVAEVGRGEAISNAVMQTLPEGRDVPRFPMSGGSLRWPRGMRVAARTRTGGMRTELLLRPRPETVRVFVTAPGYREVVLPLTLETGGSIRFSWSWSPRDQTARRPRRQVRVRWGPCRVGLTSSGEGG